MEHPATPLVPTEYLDALALVLEHVRNGTARTRSELSRVTGLGRNVIAPRVAQLLDLGLLEDGRLAPSTGGRSPRELRFRSEAGHLLVAQLGATSISVALADLSGELTLAREEPADITDGPERILQRVHELFQDIIGEDLGAGPVWGVGIGLPGPVEFATGRPSAPPIMPGWDGYDVRTYFADRFDAPVWVDNDVNVMVLGELRDGLAQGEQDVVYVKIGTGIGAGVVSAGRLHRGAQGCAGDIGHVSVGTANSDVICRCGKIGCLEALAGGGALAREGSLAAADGRSTYLAGLAAGGHVVTANEVVAGARRGDPLSLALMIQSANLVGNALSNIVNFFNPALIIIGGGVAQGAGDQYLAEIRQVIFSRSLPLATRSLQIDLSLLGQTAGLRGTAFMVVDELLSRDLLGLWIGSKTPAGQPHLTD